MYGDVMKAEVSMMEFNKAQEYIEDVAPNKRYARKYKTWESEYAPYVCRLIEDLGLHGKSFIDIGPGYGSMIKWLYENDIASSIDVVDVMSVGTFVTDDFVRSLEGKYHQHDIAREPLEYGGDIVRRDVSLSMQVLTHIMRNPIFAVENIAKMTREVSIISVTDRDKYNYNYDGIEYYDWMDVPEEHKELEDKDTMCTFNRKTFKALLDECFPSVSLQAFDCRSIIAICRRE